MVSLLHKLCYKKVINNIEIRGYKVRGRLSSGCFGTLIYMADHFHLLQEYLLSVSLFILKTIIIMALFSKLDEGDTLS